MLFQGSVGRVDLPGGDWAVLERSIEGLVRGFPPQTMVYPGHMGVTTLGRELETNPFLSELRVRVPVAAAPGATRRRALSDPQIKAPRGTFDVLGEQAAARVTLEERARRLLEGAGYERIETPVFEATELFSRGVGTSTDIVRKEMFTFKDASDRSLTLRPEGTAPVCRAYVEHGMHKRRQPVKLWYLSSFFRHERAQAGRYREFWQVGAEALGSEDPAVDAESIALLWTLLGEMGVRARLRLGAWAAARAGARTARSCRRTCARTRRASREEVPSRIEENPLRAFDSDHEGTRRVMESAPRLLDQLERRGHGAFRGGARACWTWRRCRTCGHDAGAGPGLLHAHAVRVHIGRARGAERCRWRRTLRRPGRAARRRTRRRGWDGLRGSSGSSSRAIPSRPR